MVHPLLRGSVVPSKVTDTEKGKDTETQIAANCEWVSTDVMWDALGGKCCTGPDELLNILHDSLGHAISV